LQKGRWNGAQLIPRLGWNRPRQQVSNGSDPTKDWDQGYGFQFWRCRHNAYRGDGAFGQFCLVLPTWMQLWRSLRTRAICKGAECRVGLLLEAFRPVPIEVNPAEEKKLKETLANLAVREGQRGECD
jgi:hypothetical protein